MIKKKQPVLSNQYMSKIFSLCKFIAFHELYMEKIREQLSQDESFDLLTAFKTIDSFKHNKVPPYELYSFFDLASIESTIQECQNIIKCLNKSLTVWSYEDFEEIVAPRNLVLRNISLTRFDKVKVGVGSYSLLTDVKEHSKQAIALFLEKQLSFCREYLWRRQQFCREEGGDVYSMVQELFKFEQKSIDYPKLFEIARKHQVIFNEQEYRALWRRSKKIIYKIEDQDCLGFPIQKKDFADLLLVNSFKTKQRFALEQGVPIQKATEIIQPSYNKSHWHIYDEQKMAQEHRMKEAEIEAKKMEDLRLMRVRFSVGVGQEEKHTYLKKKWDEWQERVSGMDTAQINREYEQYRSKRTHN